MAFAAATIAYNAFCMANPWYRPQTGGRFFKRKNWREWVPDIEVEAKVDDPLLFGDPEPRTISGKTASEAYALAHGIKWHKD